MLAPKLCGGEQVEATEHSVSVIPVPAVSANPSFFLTPPTSLHSAGRLPSERRPGHLGAWTVSVPTHRAALQLVRAAQSTWCASQSSLCVGTWTLSGAGRCYVVLAWSQGPGTGTALPWTSECIAVPAIPRLSIFAGCSVDSCEAS